MSRSFKKVAGWTCGYKGDRKSSKRFANKAVRNTEELVNGMMYKKVSESYDICDFKFLEFWDSVAKYDWRARRK